MLRYCADGLTGEGHRWLLVRWYNGAANQAETAAREALAITADPAGDARLPLAILAQIASAIETTTRPQSLAAPRPHHHRMAPLPRRPRLRTGPDRAAHHRQRPHTGDARGST